MAFTDEQQGGAPPPAENPSVDQPGNGAVDFEPGGDLDDGYPTEDSGTQTAVATVPAAQSTSRVVAMSFCEPRSCRLQLSS